MNRLLQLFPQCKNKMALIGMIHAKSFPGTPRNQFSVEEIVDKACAEAELYAKYKVDGLLIENMHDVPYVTKKDSGPEITSVMTRVCSEVKKIVPNVPCGVQMLAALNEEALAVALAANLQFIRAESFIFGHIADEGLMTACAGPLLRYRKSIGADDILILTDIKKKHASHALTSDVNVIAMAKSAKFFLSDGIVLTGTTTGQPPNVNDVFDVKLKVPEMPVIIGSGVNSINLKDFSNLNINALIVGSHFKENGFWLNEIDEKRLSNFMQNLENLYS